MKNMIIRVSAFFMCLFFLFSCGNSTEVIEDPQTGVVLKKYDYYLDDNGQKVIDGEFKQWSKSGELIEELIYKDGKVDGEQIVYEGKDLIYYNTYKNGVRTGISKLLNSKGVLISEFIYKDDLLSGPTIHYTQEGVKYLEAEYKIGLPSGVWHYYNEEGEEVGVFEFDVFTPKNLLGKWKIKDKKNTYFEFKNDGSMSLLESNRYTRRPFATMVGRYIISNKLDFIYKSGGGEKIISFIIKSIKEDEIEMVTEATDELYVLLRE